MHANNFRTNTPATAKLPLFLKKIKQITWLYAPIAISTPVFAQNTTPGEIFESTQISTFHPVPEFLLWAIVGGVYLLIFFSLTFVIARLSKEENGKRWLLADALSEEATEESQGVKTVRLVASTSRLIALFGLIVILVLFLSFGIITIWSFGRTGKAPTDLAELAKYLLGGAALFIPYGINQIRATFDNVTK